MATVHKPYAYHKPSQIGLEKITLLREAFTRMDEEIRQICPDTRERALAITKNEEAAMWAIKAVVFNDPNSEVEQ